jgi:hypothetical protein
MKKFKVGQIVEDYDGNPCKVIDPNIGSDGFIEVQRLVLSKKSILFMEDVQRQGASKATVITVAVVGFLVLCAIVSLIVNWTF